MITATSTANAVSFHSSPAIITAEKTIALPRRVKKVGQFIAIADGVDLGAKMSGIARKVNGEYLVSAFVRGKSALYHRYTWIEP